MKTINLIVLTSLLLVIYSCRNEKDNVDRSTSTVINVKLGDKAEFLGVSDVLELTRYVKLETTPQSLIGQIGEVIISDSLIYVLDGKLAKSIFFYYYSIYRFCNSCYKLSSA